MPDLDRHLAACAIALVQGGLTTCMELVAAGTPFVYFPLRSHFEQNFHVAHRLQRYGAGRRTDFAASTPEAIAEAVVETLTKPATFRPVAAEGAARAAQSPALSERRRLRRISQLGRGFRRPSRPRFRPALGAEPSTAHAAPALIAGAAVSLAGAAAAVG